MFGALKHSGYICYKGLIGLGVCRVGLGFSFGVSAWGDIYRVAKSRSTCFVFASRALAVGAGRNTEYMAGPLRALRL